MFANLFKGKENAGGAGVTTDQTLRTCLASDSPGVSPVLAAGTAHVGQVGTPADVISVTPTTSATPDYSAGDAVGGKQTLTSAARTSGGKVILQSLTVIDVSNQKKDITILFFDSDPAAATITDNAAFAFSTDISKVVGRVNIADTDYETVNGKAIACLKGIGLEMKCSGSANLYAAVIATEAINGGSTADYTFKYGFLQN